MFPINYFAKRFFAPRYYPPDEGVVSGAGGGGRRGRKFDRIKKDDEEILYMLGSLIGGRYGIS